MTLEELNAQKISDAIGGIITSTTKMELDNMTLDELEEKFELDELWKRHEAGEKLEFSEYHRLAKTTINWDFVHDMPDFDDMANDIERQYPDISDRIVVYQSVLLDFENMISILDQSDPIDNSMIFDWSFGKKCRLSIEFLESMLKSKSFNSSKKVEIFSAKENVTKEKLSNIFDILCADGWLESSKDIFLYWFGYHSVENSVQMKWNGDKGACAKMIQIICGQNNNKALKEAFGFEANPSDRLKGTGKKIKSILAIK